MARLFYFTFSVRYDSRTFEKLMASVSAERRTKVCRLKPLSSKLERLYAGAFLTGALKRFYGLPADRLLLAEDGFGKPFLPLCPRISFNISHTSGAVAAVFSDEPVGADIEKIGEDRRAVAEKFFTPAENEYIYGGADPAVRFYEIWTRKEAFLKMKGNVREIPLRSFDTLSAGLAPCLTTVCADGYAVSAAVSSPREQVAAEQLSEEQALEIMLSQ